ncbi:hypothetical protein M9H77_34394 [Catharanthus roseus]|uniref:Uncharacterized protein n=1 Tax=Catharanthus roseus TaxID=4058 RepID=A0ACB9ZMR8_CATRO|nr:hypothetical protein M9H77_34394 [Catharanthus roseus]
MVLGGIQEEAIGGTAESATRVWWRGTRQAHWRWEKIDEAFHSRNYMSYCIKLKENVKLLHIETGSPILTDEPLMPCLWFRLIVCSCYRGALGRQQQFFIGSFGIFCGNPRGLYRERERRLLGYMQ